MVTHIFKVDINSILVDVEQVVDKYIPDLDGVWYVNSLRFPLTDKHNIKKYGKMGMLTDKPPFPIKCIAMVCDYIKFRLYSEYPQLDVFVSNTLCPGIGEQHLPANHVDVEDIVLDHLPRILHTDLTTVCILLGKAYGNMHSIVNDCYGRVITIDVETEFVSIVAGKHIKEIRFDELKERMIFEKETEHIECTEYVSE